MRASPDCPTVCIECVRETPYKHVETWETCPTCNGKGGIPRDPDKVAREIEEFCDEVGTRELCSRHLARARAEAMES